MILRNSIVCNNCNHEIVSRHRHDYITCSCGQVSIDGGSSYLRRGGNNYIDTSISSNDDFDKIRNKFDWGTNGIDGKQRLQYIKLKDMETTHIEAILSTQLLFKEIKKIFKMELNFRKKPSRTQETPELAKHKTIHKSLNAAIFTDIINQKNISGNQDN